MHERVGYSYKIIHMFRMINRTLRPTGCMAMNKLFCIFGDFYGSRTWGRGNKNHCNVQKLIYSAFNPNKECAVCKQGIQHQRIQIKPLGETNVGVTQA